MGTVVGTENKNVSDKETVWYLIADFKEENCCRAGFEPVNLGLWAVNSWGNWEDRNTDFQNPQGFIGSMII